MNTDNNFGKTPKDINVFIDEDGIRTDNFTKWNIRGNNREKTALVKYRQQLSPKYMQMYKQKERERSEFDRSLVYKPHKPLNQFDPKISGFNWTIPTLWKANRFRSTASSAFGLSINDDQENAGKKKQVLKNVKENSKYKKTRGRRQINTKNATKDISINSDLDGDSQMIININKRINPEYIPILVH